MVCATSKASDQPAHTRSLIRAFASMSVKLLTKHNLEFRSLKGGCTGSSESTLVKMSDYWKSLKYINSGCSMKPHLVAVHVGLKNCLKLDKSAFIYRYGMNSNML